MSTPDDDVGVKKCMKQKVEAEGTSIHTWHTLYTLCHQRTCLAGDPTCRVTTEFSDPCSIQLLNTFSWDERAMGRRTQTASLPNDFLLILIQEVVSWEDIASWLWLFVLRKISGRREKWKDKESEFVKERTQRPAEVPKELTYETLFCLVHLFQYFFPDSSSQLQSEKCAPPPLLRWKYSQNKTQM